MGSRPVVCGFLVSLTLAATLAATATAQTSAECGDLDASGVVGATDALLLLKSSRPIPCMC